MSFRQRRRRGAAAVEFALVCPILMVTFWVALEFCRVQMLQHTMQNAVYEAARQGLVPGTSDGDIEAAAAAMMNAVAVTSPDIAVTQTDDEVTVQIAVRYADAAWLAPIVFKESTLQATIELNKDDSED